MSTKMEYLHPSLGLVRGLAFGPTNQFLGIPYATLDSKWSPPVMSEPKKGTLDATKFGPMALSPPNAVEIEFAHIQRRLPVPHLEQSDTACLNLNITTPGGASAVSNLPVIVFVHGGGYAIGSNAWPQYDFRRVVALSVSEGRPVIGVNINFRLGALGFLTSEELVSQGYQPNNGLHDQRTALLWLQRHITGFGGDPKNITIVGESAGGASATLQLQSKQPLFKRMISMGGTNLFMQPLPHEVVETTYEAIVDRLGLGGLSPSERVKTLVSLETQKLLSATRPSDALLPSLGGVAGVQHHTYAELYHGTAGQLDLPGREWCQQIMVGDCQMDASILSLMLNRSTDGIAPAFRESLTRSLASADKAAQILSAYSISEHIPDDQALKAILKFASDICFFVPVLNYGHCWSGNAFLYQFNEPNTWEGPWKGYANHILDVAYLFQNYNDDLTDRQRAVAIQFAKDVILFANGQRPWPVFRWETSDLSSRVYGGRVIKTSGEVMTVSGPDSRTERSKTILVLMESVSADELSRAWGNFMAGA
ncbi:Lipase 2 [Penicillium rolfsii]|nr:Lipase 2 [Penicillium rolfsii]